MWREIQYFYLSEYSVFHTAYWSTLNVFDFAAAFDHNQSFFFSQTMKTVLHGLHLTQKACSDYLCKQPIKNVDYTQC